MSDTIYNGAGLSATSSVLLVDDEVDILPEYQELLEMAGVDALTEADSGAAVGRVLQDPNIVVVVTDLKMGRMHGADLIKTLRNQMPAGRKIEFIVLTGDATSDPVAQELAVPILLKPVDADTLISTVQKALAETQ